MYTRAKLHVAHAHANACAYSLTGQPLPGTVHNDLGGAGIVAGIAQSRTRWEI